MENTEQQLQTQALTWPERAQALAVRDQQTYDQATALLKGTALLEKEIKNHYGPLKQAAHNAHKKITAAEKGILEPVERAGAILRGSIGKYTQEQERIRREEERRVREEAVRIERERIVEEASQREARRKEEEEKRLEVATEAESFGATEEEIHHILEGDEDIPQEWTAPPPVATPRVQPTFQATKGVSTREVWSAQVTSIRVLAHAVGTGNAAPNLIQPNMVALNGLARSLKGAMNVPGVKAVAETTTAVRTA